MMNIDLGHDNNIDRFSSCITNQLHWDFRKIRLSNTQYDVKELEEDFGSEYLRLLEKKVLS